jgi:hypothetical protein
MLHSFSGLDHALDFYLLAMTFVHPNPALAHLNFACIHTSCDWEFWLPSSEQFHPRQGLNLRRSHLSNCAARAANSRATLFIPHVSPSVNSSERERSLSNLTAGENLRSLVA